MLQRHFLMLNRGNPNNHHSRSSHNLNMKSTFIRKSETVNITTENWTLCNCKTGDHGEMEYIHPSSFRHFAISDLEVNRNTTMKGTAMMPNWTFVFILR